MDIGCLVLMKKYTLDFQNTSNKLQCLWTSSFQIMNQTSMINQVIVYVNWKHGTSQIMIYVKHFKLFIEQAGQQQVPKGHVRDCQ